MLLSLYADAPLSLSSHCFLSCYKYTFCFSRNHYSQRRRLIQTADLRKWGSEGETIDIEMLQHFRRSSVTIIFGIVKHVFKIIFQITKTRIGLIVRISFFLGLPVYVFLLQSYSLAPCLTFSHHQTLLPPSDFVLQFYYQKLPFFMRSISLIH